MGAKIDKGKSELWSIEDFNKEFNKLKKDLVYTDNWVSEESIKRLDIYNAFINQASSKITESALESNFDWIPKQLGLRVGGFSILNTYTSYQVLLENKDISEEESNFYPKIDFLLNETEDSHRKAISKDESAAIDALFIGRRSKQGFNNNDLETPEFYTHIGDKNKTKNGGLNDIIISKTENWKGLKDDTDFLYCPVGEVLFYIYAWRLYIKKDITELSSSEAPIFLNNFDYFSKYFSLELNEYSSEKHGFLRVFDQFYEKEQNSSWNTEEEWETLGLQKKSEDKIEFTPSTYKLIEFAIHFEEYSLPNGTVSFQKQLSKLQEDFLTEKNFSIFFKADSAKKFREYWNDYIVNVITKYSEFTKSGSIKELIKDARFPIAAYFFQYFLQKGDKYPIAHFAFPIWTTTTPEYVLGKKEYNKANPIIIVGLFTVEPVWSTLNNFEYKYFQSSFSNFENKDNPQYQNFDRVRLLIHELARGVVEKGFYRNIALKDILSKSRRSAISQVMARNLSHNIGSHVLSRLVTPHKIEEIFANSQKLFEPKQFQYEFSLNELSQISIEKGVQEDPLSNIYKQLGIFNSYLKSLMDFLADVATTTPTVEVPKLFIKDVLKGFAQNLILRDLISGVDDFYYQFKVVINGKEQDLKLNSEKSYDLRIEDFENIIVSMPNDILGCHAFYIILKNIIRNTAKHGQKKNVEFTIDIKNCYVDNTYYEIVIYDNVWKETTEEIVVARNKQINESVLDDKTFELRSGGWGMIEMEVCAAYLRKIPIEDIDDPKYHVSPDANNNSYRLSDNDPLNPLRAVKIDNSKGEGCSLGYRFFLMKPKEVLVLNESIGLAKKFNDDSRKELLNQGILFLDKIDQLNGLWTYDPLRNDPHQVLLYITRENVLENDNYLRSITTYLQNKQGSLPHRLIVVVDNYTFEWQDDQVPKNPAKQIAFISRSTFELEGLPLFFDVLNSSQLKKWLWKRWLLNKYAYFKIKEIRYFSPGKDSEDYIGRSRGNSVVAVTNLHELKPNLEYIHNEAYPSSVQGWIDLAADKGTSIKNGIKYITKSNIYYAFLDAFLANVLILDERIQEIGGHQFLEHFKGINVYIPPIEIANLSKTNFSDLYYPLKEWINKFSEHKKELKIQGIDFLVVHLGIIEKLLDVSPDFYDYSKNKGTNAIRSFIDHFFGESELRPFKLIIESGRGKPSNLPPELPYLNYSIVSQYCLDQKLKFLLVSALSSARKHQES